MKAQVLEVRRPQLVIARIPYAPAIMTRLPLESTFAPQPDLRLSSDPGFTPPNPPFASPIPASNPSPSNPARTRLASLQIDRPPRRRPAERETSVTSKTPIL
jgi:hypothetical protein